MSRQFYQETVTCIRAMDLIRIANRLLNDNMQFVRLSIVDSSREDEAGSVLIDALPNIDSDDAVHYPAIKSFSILDIDAFGYRN